MSPRRSLPSWPRNIVVVLTALVALLAMHGLTSDHAMGATVEPSSGSASAPASAHVMAVADVVPGKAMVSGATTAVATIAHRMGHDGGMCVAILGAALLLWLVARSRHRRDAGGIAARRRATATWPARAGPPSALLCPSSVKLCVLRT